MITELPVPNYVVTDPLNNHKYKIVFPDGRPTISDLASVTGQLKIIGGPSVNILINWAKKQVALTGQDLIIKALTAPEPLTPAIVEAIMLQAKKKPKDIFEDAGKLGDAVHKYIEGWIKCYLIKKEFRHEDYVPKENIWHEKAKVGFNNFIKWMHSQNLVPLCGDLAVASVKHRFGGRLDALFTDGKYLYLLDWKTSNYMKDDMAAQVGGYNEGLWETYGLRATRGIVVRFAKEDENVFEPNPVNMKGAAKLWKDVVRMNKSYDHKKLWITKK